METSLTLERSWLLEILRSLQGWERDGYPAKNVGIAVQVLMTMELLPKGRELDVMNGVLAEATLVLERKPTADDFKGQALEKLLKQVQAT